MVNEALSPDALRSLARLEKACRANASQFSREAVLLFSSGAYARAFFLAQSGREELAKAQLAADRRQGDLSEEQFWSIFANHSRKFSYLKRSVADGHPEREVLSITIDDTAGIPEKLAREEALYVSADRNTFEPSTPESKVGKAVAEKAISALNDEISASNFLDLFGGANSRTAAAVSRRNDPAG